MLLQDRLANEYKYKKLPFDISEEARLSYLSEIPASLKLEGDINFKLYSNKGTLFSTGYNRIVVGDYGAFIEFDTSQILRENIKIKNGQEYRVNDDKYKRTVKYAWLTCKDDSDIKIYYQYRTVEYADYSPERFYVSHYEILF